MCVQQVARVQQYCAGRAHAARMCDVADLVVREAAARAELPVVAEDVPVSLDAQMHRRPFAV